MAFRQMTALPKIKRLNVLAKLSVLLGVLL
jgi:hypothetical protein